MQAEASEAKATAEADLAGSSKARQRDGYRERGEWGEWREIGLDGLDGLGIWGFGLLDSAY